LGQLPASLRLLKYPVSVEKVPQLMLVGLNGSGYKQAEYSMLLFITFGGAT
jgi:hypothetical protein